jgi:hypothetical protein
MFRKLLIAVIATMAALLETMADAIAATLPPPAPDRPRLRVAASGRLCPGCSSVTASVSPAARSASPAPGFSGCTVLFTRAGHPLAAFHRADFSDSPVVFDDAGFSGGEVSLEHSWHWAHPPGFSWDGKPRLGVAAAADLQGMELISINSR